MRKITYYDILEVPQNATQDQIRKAYKKKIKQFHPDINKSFDAEKKAKQINQAYTVLNNPISRKEYDLRVEEAFNQNTSQTKQTPPETPKNTASPNSTQPEASKNPVTPKQKRSWSYYVRYAIIVLIIQTLIHLRSNSVTSNNQPTTVNITPTISLSNDPSNTTSQVSVSPTSIPIYIIPTSVPFNTSDPAPTSTNSSNDNSGSNSTNTSPPSDTPTSVPVDTLVPTSMPTNTPVPTSVPIPTFSPAPIPTLIPTPGS